MAARGGHLATVVGRSELVTLPVMQALLGYTSEARWLRHCHARMRHLFPYIPLQPGYNKVAARRKISFCPLV